MDTNNSQPTKDELSLDELLDIDLIKLLGVENMAPEAQADIYKKAADTIQMRVFARIDALLSDEEAEDLKKIADSNDKEKFDAFMNEKGFDLEQISLEEALVYKAEMAVLVDEMDKARNGQP